MRTGQFRRPPQPRPGGRRSRWVAGVITAIALVLAADAGASARQGRKPVVGGGDGPGRPAGPKPEGPNPEQTKPAAPAAPAAGVNPEAGPQGMNPGGRPEGPGGVAGAGGQQGKAIPAEFTAEEQQKVNKAIDDAISFLKKSQNDTGSWGPPGEKIGQGHWAAGYTALAGLALIEAGVSPEDAQIQKAAKLIRSAAPNLDATYEVSLSILFLDRLKDPKKDERTIQMLAARLIAGQTASGGWGYKVPARLYEPTRDAASKSMLTALRALNPTPPNDPSPRERPSRFGLCIKTGDDMRSKGGAGPDDPEKARKAAVSKLDPAWLKIRPVFANIANLAMTEPEDGKRSDPLYPKPDNSNTHFALLALWAARKHDVPTERTYALLARRFRTDQAEDGTWGYDFKKPENRPAMTCVALLALAIGHVLSIDQDANAKLEQDPKVLKAFAALGKRVGAPTGRMEGLPQPNQAGGLYFLWAVERIAVLYDVRQLSGKDWYRWGAEILVSSQTPDGSWANGGYHGENAVVNTCFALMFLKRANLTPDLSRKLVVDAAALTKTEEKPAPKVAPPPEPSPAPEPMEEPPPPPAPKPKPEPKQAAVESTPSSPPEEKKSKLPLLLGLLGVVLVGGVVAFFAVRMSKDDDDEDKPKKKKGVVKKKARLVADED
jgi:outer membrane biosynthesis protein TonB